MGEETIVTRGSQITITRNVRKKLGINEGDKVVLNIEGDMLMISKRDKTVFDNFEGFLPANFERILKKIRAKKGERLKRLGIAQ